MLSRMQNKAKVKNVNTRLQITMSRRRVTAVKSRVRGAEGGCGVGGDGEQRGLAGGEEHEQEQKQPPSLLSPANVNGLRRRSAMTVGYTGYCVMTCWHLYGRYLYAIETWLG